MNIVSSHDSPRIATVTGDRALVEVAVAAMFTLPGVPMIWSGDEIGLAGLSGEEGRHPFPWHQPDRWDTATLATYREMARIRAASDALRSGSLRWLYADDDRLVFVRETVSQTVLVLLARGPGPQFRLPTAALGLQDGHNFDSLFSSAAHGPTNDLPQFPGEGPGVWVWIAERQ
jgi:alpha-glucosidase